MSSIGSEAVQVVPAFHFKGRYSTELTNAILSKAVRLLLDRLSPAGWEREGLFVVDCLAHSDFSAMCKRDPDLLDLSAADQAILRQCYAFFGKRKDIDIGVDREATAVAKFRDAEELCAVTNSCFRAWSQGRFQFRPEVEHVLHVAQYKISKLLGAVPSLSEIRPRFGPGATTQTPKKNACAVVKLQDMLACTANLEDPVSLAQGLGIPGQPVDSCRPDDWTHLKVPKAPPYSCGNPDRSREDSIVLKYDFEIVNGKLSFVDKNATTKRAVIPDAPLQGVYQLGLGDVMARLLLKVGIDLKDQTRNQRAALYGSLSNASATVDLSSASDTIALKLVEHLFPSEWFSLFRSLRAAEVVYRKGKQVELIQLEKISSMGNGFTFPLETILFWAIAQACVEISTPRTRIRTLVYGDDIIVDAGAVPLLYRALHDLGFVPNTRKSFSDGPFRESCGKDYVFGIDVRPVYVDDALEGADLFRLHNFFWSKGDTLLSDFWKSWIDPSIRTFGPPGFGDGYLHSSTWNAKPGNQDRGYGGVTFESWTLRPKRLRSDIAKRLATPTSFHPQEWDEKLGGWRRAKHPITVMRFHTKHWFLVRRLATYMQYLRETDDGCLTASDRARSRGEHVYCDRRMPDPINTRDDRDWFVVPGDGKAVRTKIYIFEQPG